MSAGTDAPLRSAANEDSRPLPRQPHLVRIETPDPTVQPLSTKPSFPLENRPANPGDQDTG